MTGGNLELLPLLEVLDEVNKRSTPNTLEPRLGYWLPGQVLRVMLWERELWKTDAEGTKVYNTWAAVVDPKTKKLAWTALLYHGIPYMQVIGEG